MGLEVETVVYGSPVAPQELLQLHAVDFDQLVSEQQAVKTKSLNGGLQRKKRALHAMTKAHSDKTISVMDHEESLSQMIAGSASLQSGLAQEESNQTANVLSAARRQMIMERAEEIIREKQQVGMQYGESCPICLGDDVDTQLTSCGHLVHAKCIKRWIQNGSKCPVCREIVTGMEEAFTCPSSPFSQPFEKDLPSESDSTSSETQGYEWGWFEDCDDDDDQDDDTFCMGAVGVCNQQERSGRRAALMNRDMSTTFEVCRTFPPLRATYDTLYADSKYTWMRQLPSHRHIAAKIQIRSFRIVETKSKTQYAEYLIEIQLDGRYFSRWRRYSELTKYASTLASTQYRQTLAAWTRLEASSRWFNRLELSYLHHRCQLLEEFAHALLLESSTAHPLADLLDG